MNPGTPDEIRRVKERIAEITPDKFAHITGKQKPSAQIEAWVRRETEVVIQSATEPGNHTNYFHRIREALGVPTDRQLELAALGRGADAAERSAEAASRSATAAEQSAASAAASERYAAKGNRIANRANGIAIGAAVVVAMFALIGSIRAGC